MDGALDSAQLIGATLGDKYRIERKLGAGGY